MGRMLGRYQTPGCCPGTRQGWYRMRRVDGIDCSGGDTSTRWRKRVEQRDVIREASEWQFSRAWADWLSPEDQAYDDLDAQP